MTVSEPGGEGRPEKSTGKILPYFYQEVFLRYNCDIMADALWKSLLACVTDERVSEATNALGERKAAVTKGLKAALALVALGRGDDPVAAASLATHANLSEASASALLATARPLVAGVLAREFGGVVPDDAQAALLKAAPTLPLPAASDPDGEKLALWIAPPIALLALGGLTFFLLRGGSPAASSAAVLARATATAPTALVAPAPDTDPTPLPALATPAPEALAPVVSASPEPTAAPVLPNDAPSASPAASASPTLASPLPTPQPSPAPTPSAAPGSIEEKLTAYLKDPATLPDKETWFDFDQLTFDTNKATLRDSSMAQLDRVGALLKANPSVHVKIGGYTDNVGGASDNLKLSSWRAENVRDALLNRGVARERMEFEGYGVAHPLASNATPEGRAKNRRIALRVTKK